MTFSEQIKIYILNSLLPLQEEDLTCFSGLNLVDLQMVSIVYMKLE